MLIRDAVPADRAGVRHTVATAFGSDAVADLWDDVVARGHARFSLVAVDDETVVGHVGVSHGWLDAPRSLVDVLVLSPLSVLPARQRTEEHDAAGPREPT